MRQQREEAVGCGGPDDLDPALLLEQAKGSDQVAVDGVKEAPEPEEARVPVARQRRQVARSITGPSTAWTADAKHEVPPCHCIA